MMQQSRVVNFIFTAVLSVFFFSCGNSNDPTEPTDIAYGTTTFVFLVNPPINDLNDAVVPTPGTVRSGVTVSIEGGPSGTTDADGVVVFSDITFGAKSVTFDDGTNVDTLTISIADKDLREVAVALDGTGAAVMANVHYAFGGQVVEVTPSMTITEVNDALSNSNTIVFMKAGTYTGDLVFSGSSVTLFGEGKDGGQVTINGAVEIGGSGGRIRGATLTSTLTVAGSDFGLSFSHLVNTLELGGSTAVLLNNSFCVAATVTGSGNIILGNEGMAPIAAPGSC